ncbi:MAG: hypothetical protein JO252_25745 [Planctomycetaceae bacterium]|nr:hypothetical protein [Planctomycetaceae bacterium]
MTQNPIRAPSTPAAPTISSYNLPQYQQPSLISPSSQLVIDQGLLNQIRIHRLWR